MKRLAIAVALAACSMGTTAAFAHPYRWYYAPWPVYGPRYYWYAPGYAYPPWTYAPPPPPRVVVPRYYPPVYASPPAPPPVQRRYAEAAPPAPAPQPAPFATPAPRLNRYTLSAKELFGFDEATIRGRNAKLDEIADAMKRNPKIDHVTITGYTDRLGSDAYNLKLSQRRADAVKRYLVERGVQADRLETVGKGKADPVVECHDKDRAKLIQCLEPNRRVEVEQIVVEATQT